MIARRTMPAADASDADWDAYFEDLPKWPHLGKRPWSPQPDEGRELYAIFGAYLKMGIGPGGVKQQRCLKRLRKDYLGIAEDDRETHPTENTLRMWSSENRWRARAKAYDEHIDAGVRELTQDAMEASQRRHIGIASKMQALAHIELEKRLTDAASAEGYLEGLSTRDLLRLAEVGVKLERLARGEATEHVEATSGGLPVDQYSVEQLKALRALKNTLTGSE